MCGECLIDQVFFDNVMEPEKYEISRRIRIVSRTDGRLASSSMHPGLLAIPTPSRAAPGRITAWPAA